MGLFDSLSSFIPFSTPVDAEAASDNAEPRGSVKGESADEADANKTDDKDGDDADEDGAKSADGGDGDEPAEEEEEEEEPEDPMPVLQEECMNSAGCKPHKTHYDECALRVDEQIEKFGKPKEDCVEEFFELAHCAGACAAPKLWKQLK